MAAKARPETKVEAVVQTEVPAVKAEPKFVVEKLRSNCVEVFGVTSSTFDGAMYGHDLDAEYSISEVKHIIDAFLNGGK